MFDHYTEEAKQTIFLAKGEAAQLGSTEIDTEHILLALLKDKDVTSRLMEGLSVSQIRQDILGPAVHHQEPPPPVDLPLSMQSRELLALAEKEAQKLADRHVSNAHILLGLLHLEGSRAGRVLESNGLSLHRVRTLIAPGSSDNDFQAVDPTESLDLSGVATELAAHPDLRRLMQTTIPQVKELWSRGEHRSVLKLLDDLMAESVPDQSLRIRQMAPLAVATARSIGDIRLVKHYCELRLANDPNDVMALYGMAECLAEQGDPEGARTYATRCQELSAARGDAFGQSVIELLQGRFHERKSGT